MQGDGNLVWNATSNGAIVWNSRTYNTGNSSAVMQGDGNFVVYKGTSGACHSNTPNSGGVGVLLQDDGNMVIYNAYYQPVWSSRYSV